MVDILYLWELLSLPPSILLRRSKPELGQGHEVNGLSLVCRVDKIDRYVEDVGSIPSVSLAEDGVVPAAPLPGRQGVDGAGVAQETQAGRHGRRCDRRLLLPPPSPPRRTHAGLHKLYGLHVLRLQDVLTAKEGKHPAPPPPAALVRESLPAPMPTYLSHSPPVLLHPERVVPMSESERFERSFQPNVALAPNPPKHRGRQDVSKYAEVKLEEVQEEVDKKPSLKKSPSHLSLTIPPMAAISRNGLATYNPEIELSTDTDDSLSDITGETALRAAENRSVVDQVAAVMDTLSDAKEATRSRVVELVERLVSRLDHAQDENNRLQQDNRELVRLHREQELRIDELQRRLRDFPTIKPDPDAFAVKMVSSPSEVRSSRGPGGSIGGGSPVSVIHSPPSQHIVIATVKSEPDACSPE
uniref:Uncharacterized protein n=1 Tax=Timema shepardi TaxID=629360 RepID=A0A7R9ASR4_TIMSH|nr:unnamed protein product [Timema shepardi]